MSTKSSDDLASDGKPSEGNPSDGKPSDGKPTIRSHHLSRRTQYRYHKAVGDAGIDICLLTLALVGAQSGSSLDQDEWTHCVETASDLFEGLWGENATILNMPSLITGDDLMDVLGIPAGEKIGQILELVKEEQASGNIHTREQALEFSQIILKK